MSSLYITAITGNLVSFSAGTAQSWSSPETDKLKNSTMAVTANQISWINSFFLLGAAFGPFVFGYLADKIGRKFTVLSMGFPLTLGFLIMAFTKYVQVFYVARFIIGIVVGGVFTVFPMYLGELADSSNRGVLAGLLNAFLCLGILFSYVLGPYVGILTFNLILAFIPAAFIPLFYFFSVESPRYLISKQRSYEARVILKKIRGNKANVDSEIETIEKAIKDESKGGFSDIFKSFGNIKAMVIVIGLLSFQQFSGINAVFANTQTIFKQAGAPISPAVCSIIVGIVQIISSFLSMSLIDRLGRKILLLISGAGMFASELPLGIYSYLKAHGYDVDNLSVLPIVCLVAYILTYNLGMGSLPWTLMGELYPTNIKSIASSISASFCWFLGFIVVYYFQSLSDGIGLGPCFWIFSICCAISVVFTKFVCIETKGKTLEEIQEELNK